MLANFLGKVTQLEGKKFLQLSKEISDPEITPPDTESSVSLYIHIPFCRTLCPYCCFNRYPLNEEKARNYFQQLKRELDLYLKRGFKFSSYYFGGGTPTVMMPELLEFMNYLKENCSPQETSLETTPREINEANVNLLKEAGVNRLSIGIQSFDSNVLRAMGRVSCGKEELKAKILIAKNNFDTLNLDFIFNFPSQSIESFRSDLEILNDLGVDQATFYPLMPSPHKKTALERKFRRVDTTREKDFYDLILQNANINGYSSSTAWCFSKGKRMIDEYVVDFDDYVGIGAGSVSLIRNNFYVNTFSLGKYGELTSQSRLPVIRMRKLSDKELMYYYLLTKLFGMKLNTESFHQKFNADIHKKLRKELDFLKLSGVAREQGSIIEATRKGMYPLNVMMREFFSSLNGLREFCIENQL